VTRGRGEGERKTVVSPVIFGNGQLQPTGVLLDPRLEARNDVKEIGAHVGTHPRFYNIDKKVRITAYIIIGAVEFAKTSFVFLFFLVSASSP
jgi:hypothetical protein